MDVAALSTGINQMKLGSQVGVKVAKLAMDSVQVQSDNMLKIMQQSVTPHIGGNIDMKV